MDFVFGRVCVISVNLALHLVSNIVHFTLDKVDSQRFSFDSQSRKQGPRIEPSFILVPVGTQGNSLC